MPDFIKRMDRILLSLMAFLAISAFYLYAFPQANVFYAAIVLLHALGGVLTTVVLIPTLLRLLRSGNLMQRGGWILIGAGAVVGLILIKTGTPRSEWNKLYLHILLSLAGIGSLIAARLSARASSQAAPISSSLTAGAIRVVLCLAVIAGIAYGARAIRGTWEARNRIQNPSMPPDTMNGEGDGPE